MAKGWIKLHRKLFDNPILTRSRVFSDLEAWIWIITHVNHEEADVLVGADVMKCDRGMMITSQKKLCATFRWGNTKLRNFLKRLEKCDMIAYESTTKLTGISVIKYDTYQSNQTTNKPIANRKQIEIKSKTNTNKNVEKIRRRNTYIHNGQEQTVKEFQMFWNNYPRKVNKKRSYTIFTKLEKDNRKKAVEGAKFYASYVRSNKVNPQYIMHPSTFLNGENWNDYIHGSVQTLNPNMFRYDSTGKFVVGFCSKCGSCESYEKKTILYEDSRCCDAQLLPERMNKA